MPKPNKYILILLATVVAYVLFEYYRPKPLNWSPSYQNNHKIPFGTQALFELLPGTMGQPSVQTAPVQTVPVHTVRLPIYNFLTEQKLPPRSNYVFINERFEADKNDLKQLLLFVRRGNTCLIAAYSLSDSVAAVLGFKASIKAPRLRDSTLQQNFVNPALRSPRGYVFPLNDGRNFLRINKPANVTVLGRNARNEPVFIRVRHGKGQFLIHNVPIAFSNYYVLNPTTSDYAFKALSYLPVGPVYWDEYQKQGRFDPEQQSILRYVRSQPALNWAYYLVIIGLIAYAIFAGKRTQRIIPVVEPPQNTSLDFVKTVGRLYFQQGDHNNLTRKKVNYFLADLRERYGLNTNALNNEFIETLARKSGTGPAETAELVRLLRNAQKSISLSEADLLTLNDAIERFKNATFAS